jgi:hypothetical protein
MRITQRFGTFLAATAALTGAATFGTTSVAHAAATDVITAGGNFTGVLANGLTVAFECHAVAPGAVSTSITKCALTTGHSAAPIALPGDAAATASTATVPIAPFRLCWSASATYIDATVRTTSACTIPTPSAVPSLVGSGVSVA